MKRKYVTNGKMGAEPRYALPILICISLFKFQHLGFYFGKLHLGDG